jgi:hypothetical protein
MTVFIAGTDARTMDFEEGGAGYIPISNPYYIEIYGRLGSGFSRNIQERELPGHLAG